VSLLEISQFAEDVKPSARWADGSAMFTMVASSTTINWATPITARISQRRLPVSCHGRRLPA
jgi:hypothetical protein